MNIKCDEFNQSGLPSDMKPAEIMYEMREIKILGDGKISFYLMQKQRYTDLLKIRRDRVQFFYDNDMVQGPKLLKNLNHKRTKTVKQVAQSVSWGSLCALYY